MIYTKPQPNENANTWNIFDYQTGVVLAQDLTWFEVCEYAKKKHYPNREFDRVNSEIIFY